MLASFILALMYKLTNCQKEIMIDSSLVLFISSRVPLPIKGEYAPRWFITKKIESSPLVEIDSKQTKKCISPFDITMPAINMRPVHTIPL